MNQQDPWSMSVREFVDRAGSGQATPGGGSTSALAAALGSAMTSMAAHLSHRERTSEQLEDIEKVEDEMNQIVAESEKLMSEDMQNFAKYVQADKEAESKDDEALVQITLRTIEVPLQLMELGVRGLKVARTIAEATREHVLSDLGIGIVMFEASVRAAYLTVRINLPTCQDSRARENFGDRADRLMYEAEKLKELGLNEVMKRL